MNLLTAVSEKTTKPLTSRAIDAMKPLAKPLIDCGEYSGLRLNCGARGIKTFIYRYRSPIDNKLVQVSLGHYPTVSLAEARVKIKELKLMRANGLCPATEQRVAKQSIKDEQLNPNANRLFTVKDVIDLYLNQHIDDRMVEGRVIAGARKPIGQSQVRGTLYNDAVRVLGNTPAEKVTRIDVTKLIMEVVERGARVQAGCLLRELSAAYELAIGLDRLPESFANPAVLAKAGLRQAKIGLTPERGKRALSDSELTTLLAWLPNSDFTADQKNILRFTLLTGCRTGEVCSAEWKDIDFDKRTWHLRETKTGTERYVQLSTQATQFLMQQKWTSGVFLFPNFNHKKPLKQKTLNVRCWRLRTSGRMVDIPHWTPHDLRRTVRTGLSRLGCPSEVGDAVLGHARSGIEGTYDLHKYESECAKWLQIWADHLDGLLA